MPMMASVCYIHRAWSPCWAWIQARFWCTTSWRTIYNSTSNHEKWQCSRHRHQYFDNDASQFITTTINSVSGTDRIGNLGTGANGEQNQYLTIQDDEISVKPHNLHPPNAPGSTIIEPPGMATIMVPWAIPTHQKKQMYLSKDSSIYKDFHIWYPYLHTICYIKWQDYFFHICLCHAVMECLGNRPLYLGLQTAT